MKNKLEKSMRLSLQRTYISLQEWARSNNIYSTITRLKSGTYGFVYKSKFDNYFIIINQNLTNELQKEVFLHEVEHIIYDMPDTGYIIGLDMQHTEIEKNTDEFALKIAANLGR